MKWIVVALMLVGVTSEAEAQKYRMQRTRQSFGVRQPYNFHQQYTVRQPYSVRQTYNVRQPVSVGQPKSVAQPNKITQVSHTGQSNSTGRPASAEKSISPHHSIAQAWAQQESQLQADRGQMGHVRGNGPGRFTGVGVAMSPQNVPTCSPRGGGIVIGDATVRGRDGRYYRTRVWQ